MISDIDKDESGIIDFNDFLEIMTAKMGEKDSREDIMKAFHLFEDEEGVITLESLKKVASELGENMTDDELREMIQEAAKDEEDVVSPEEFFKIITRR
mmetsp:Transcript_44416/g.115445  ORF Transcript_44416/g.115445 Transcript_44416/m.115445 type:complete len:98 (+) Transcript_44416:664-957(+)